MQQTVLQLTPVNGNQTLWADTWRLAVSRRVRSNAALEPVFSSANAKEVDEYERADSNSLTLGAADSQHLNSLGEFPSRDQWPTPSAQRLFHHHAEGRHAKPQLCFLSTASWVGAVATGPVAISLLHSHVADMVMASQDTIGPCAMEHHGFEVDAQASEREYLYRIKSFVGNKEDRHWTPKIIRTRLLNGLNHWARLCDVAASGQDKFRVSDIAIESIENIAPAISKSNDSKSWARARAEVTFYMPFKLSGMWFSGGQNSKGHGLIRHTSARSCSAENKSGVSS